MNVYEEAVSLLKMARADGNDVLLPPGQVSVEAMMQATRWLRDRGYKAIAPCRWMGPGDAKETLKTLIEELTERNRDMQSKSKDVNDNVTKLPAPIPGPIDPDNLPAAGSVYVFVVERNETDPRRRSRVRRQIPAAGTFHAPERDGVSMITIPAITLWQPWASFIALGWKTIETRLHDRFAGLVGKRIAIHAGNQWDPDWFEAASQYLWDEQIDQVMGFRRIQGAVVAVATVERVGPCGMSDSKAALIECVYTKRQGLWLVRVEQLKRPLFAKGHQGIWNFSSDELVEAA